VGAEYIIMERATGVSLHQGWKDASFEARLQTIYSAIDLEKSWGSLTFTQHGSLYFKQDLSGSGFADLTYVDTTGKETKNSRYAVGPTTSRKFFDAGRGSIEQDLGPCMISAVSLWLVTFVNLWTRE
jgi:hypothetical protein